MTTIIVKLEHRTYWTLPAKTIIGAFSSNDLADKAIKSLKKEAKSKHYVSKIKNVKDGFTFHHNGLDSEIEIYSLSLETNKISFEL